LTVKILKVLECPSEIIEHCKTVSKKALELSSNFDVDLELVKTGSLLHDIGRSKTNGPSHGIVGAKILEDLGFSRKITKIVERHIGAGIPKEEAVLIDLPSNDYIPLTLEEKIVAHADNLIYGTREVDLNFVINKWTLKLGKDHPSLARLKKLHQELLFS